MAVFRDLYGNLWDLLQLKGVATGGVHHIDLTVRDLARSTEFYDRVLPLLGFRRSPNVARRSDLGRRAARARPGRRRARPPRTTATAAGLHHLAFSAPSPRRGRRRRTGAWSSSESPSSIRRPSIRRYAPGYYAVFFADPDGIKLEYVYTPRWPQ